MDQSLINAYNAQRQRAKSRGIEWHFTFESWLSVWKSSGHLRERGKRLGQYVMSRRGDVGPYSPNNIVICTVSENFKDAYRNGFGGGNCNLGKGRGWTYRKGHKKPYQVTVRRKYVGIFETREEAERAYKNAIKILP